MFVQAKDNKLYENPIIEGDGFYIKVEDMELPEIAIRYSPTTTKESSRALAYKRFRELDMKVKVTNSGDEDVFAFPPNWNALVPGCRWTFDFKEKMPIPTGYKSVVSYPRSDSRFIAWEMVFPITEILDFLTRDRFNSILLSFLMGKEIHPPLKTRLSETIKRQLRKQLNEQEGKDRLVLRRFD